MKRFISLGLKTGVVILALYLYGLLAFTAKVILVDEIPSVAKQRTRSELHRRSYQFDWATDVSGQMPVGACVIDDLWASFLSTEQAKALTEPDIDHIGWKPICSFQTGHVAGNDPNYLCVVLNDWTRSRGVDVEGAGENACVTEGDSLWSFVPRWPDGSSRIPRNASKTANIRLKVNNCGDGSEKHCVATVWVSRERNSWGSYLVAEMATALRRQVIGFYLLVALALAIPLSTFWRIIVVSERRHPNSPIPWIIEVPLTAAALDHEHSVFLSTLFDRCEDCLNRGLMRWPLLVGVLIQGMPTLLARRFAYLMQRPFAMGAEGTATIWKLATAGIAGRK